MCHNKYCSNYFQLKRMGAPDPVPAGRPEVATGHQGDGAGLSVK
jgi:hypothetical protein